jgi:simple sugar transport system ATP-binding protein
MIVQPQRTRTPVALEVVGIFKHFGSLVALEGVSLRVRTGTFHALLGENGAGKSTLVKCIMGYYHADAGAVLLDNREQVVRNPRQAHALGLGMVYQHFTLVPNMTVGENLVLARPCLPAVLNWQRERQGLERLLAVVPFTVDLDALVYSLAAGEKQKVEILKHLYLERRMLILDEPTSVLTPGEADDVLTLLHTMTRQGHLTVLMITHKLREVAAFADDVTVMRRGQVVGSRAVQSLSMAEVAEMMVGTQAAATTTQRHLRAPGAVRVDIQGLQAVNDRGIPALQQLSLAVHAGEIVGVAGVSGNGQRELVEVLAGQRLAEAGMVRINGQPYHAKRAEMLRHKIFCLPEEPLHNACVPHMSVAENLAFRSFDRPPLAQGGWRLQPAALVHAAQESIRRYRIKTPSPQAPIATLSGGNVQRTMLARELTSEVKVLIVANPCFGLDFATVAEIHSQIMAVRNRGAAVLLMSEDLDEILTLADRIVVMSSGRIVYETSTLTANRATIGQYMAGH